MLSEVQLCSLNQETRSRVWVHAVQLLPEKAYRDCESLEIIGLEAGAKANVIIPTVVSG